MKSVVLKILISLTICFCFFTVNSFAKNYGTITKMLITASSQAQGSVSMNYAFEVKFDESLTEPIDTIEIPMLSPNFSVKNKTQYVESIEKNEDIAIVKLPKAYKAGETARVSFMVNYTHCYSINTKNEAVYKFKFPAIKNYKVEKANFKWKIESCVHSNNTSKEENFRYWDLKNLNILSRQIFVKFDAVNGKYPESNAIEKNFSTFLAGGGFFGIIFVLVLICTIIPSDSYRKNTGFRFTT